MISPENALSYGIMASFFIFLYCAFYWIFVFFEETSKKASAEKKERDSAFLRKPFPKVTVLIPAYNCEGTLEKAIDSCFSLDYPKERLKIIVIDDGSTDGTGKLLASLRKTRRFSLIRKKNSGKAGALNFALPRVKTPFVSCLDADSFFRPGAMKALLSEISGRPEIAAVASSIKVHSPKTGIEKIQRLEYFFSIYLRRLMGRINAIYVVPGPGSLFRTDVLRKLGGFDTENLTEDMEIAFRIKRAGYSIGNSPDAEVDTLAPKSFLSLARQRTRWYAGYFQNVEKYREAILNPRFAELGLFIIPINFALIVSMTVLFGSFIYENLSSIADFARRVYLTGLDAFIFEFPDVLNFFYSLNVLNVFGIMFFVLGFFVIYASFKMSKETFFGRRENLADYVLYTIFYFPMVSVFYLMSVFYYIVKRNKGLKWQAQNFHY